MKYLAGWREVIYSATSGCFDLVGWCCRVTLLARSAIQQPVWPRLGLFICSQLQTSTLENTTCRKQVIGWKIDFFITENFLGILDRLWAEPMRRSHAFLSLTLAVVGSTSGSCYFLLQCRCLSVSVLCVLVVSCMKSQVGESEKIWCILLYHLGYHQSWIKNGLIKQVTNLFLSWWWM